MNTEYIASIETINTGGGCLVDVITLKDGRVIGLNDECVVMYKNMDDFNSLENADRPAFTL